MLRTRSYKPALLLLAAALLALMAAPAHTRGQARPGRDMQKEAALWAELQTIAPTEVEHFKQATEALDRNDSETAVRLYRAVRQRAPEWDAVNRRLGYALVRVGQKEEGLALLRQAVAARNSPDNLLGLAQTLAYPTEQTQGSGVEKQEARALAEEALRLNKDTSDPSYALLLGQLALEQDAIEDFRTATQWLVAHQPDLMPTHYFSAILAAGDEDWLKAEREIKRAGELGLNAEIVQQFLDSGVHRRALAWRGLYLALGATIIWAAGILLMFVLGKYLSKRTLRQLEAADPNVPAGPDVHRLRAMYRKVINLAGLYYYISLPVVALLVLGLAAGIIYAFLLLGRIPIKLVVVIGLGALMTVYQMIRSLFTRYKPEDPGRVLARAEAPGLWALMEEVAAQVGTRPVNEIRVTPGTEVAVYERGSFRARMNDEAERVLLVGLGVLNGFKQNAFRAVLAHEYGHFVGRDTAGGDIALRVKNDMLNFARGIVASRQNTYWNLGFHFLRLYFKIFTIISHGASRLQEVLADRLAVYHYGAAAFKDGLTHVIRREIGFDHAVRLELANAQSDRRALVNLYELAEPAGPNQQRTIEEEFAAMLSRATDETDTHPSPTERFRLISRINAREVPAAPGEVWELFADRAALTTEMSNAVAQQLRG
ncbi:MAG TPA: M48 family metalloprotease [Pyrinomonadaceae bacterium]